jgi:glutamyl/glutaminyl-tRNA synthetase
MRGELPRGFFDGNRPGKVLVHSLLIPHYTTYRGRIAPSPTGYLHRGHARTFWTAQERADAAGGTLIFRNDDLDRARVRPQFVGAMFEDLKWLGLRWSEGPDVGGPHAPYVQSERLPLYREAFNRLKEAGCLFPCSCSRKDIASAAGAPHAEDDEPVYPGTCRERRDPLDQVNWRFQVPQGEEIWFEDRNMGVQRAIVGVDFGDFPVWRKDDLPSYQLACVVDDALMGITEVVRGADLISSTFRQILLFRALGWTTPGYYHCPLILDENGRRLAKRDAGTTIRGLREAGAVPEDFRK